MDVEKNRRVRSKNRHGVRDARRDNTMTVSATVKRGVGVFMKMSCGAQMIDKQME